MSVLEGTAVQGLASALQQAISFETMITNITAFVGLIAGVVIFAFSYRLVKKLVTGASRGKAKM